MSVFSFEKTINMMGCIECDFIVAAMIVYEKRMSVSVSNAYGLST